ncbi:unnamed protein product [Didymodactylos carnosus]|uniref:ALMS motif domain-containing protein n=1 Tax=Didymodactylos carnosus TaxID=1234261 RepID=A0A813PGF9_9BILA|nr:unnamed protein product [Didymodactylos carnosus]CAF0750233.1 unnamed protein product [Didymodactylos carnosus]CAF3492992.1 unnamed protein product [Didymodactylos carnosus]CAF3529661.1 unnamed protein product [Didymodactylos carnosus]
MMSAEHETTPEKPSIELLEAIVRDCQQNEQRLQELERHTRHERKKAEKLLHETTLTKINHLVKTKTNNRENNTNNDERMSTYHAFSLKHDNDSNGKNYKNDRKKTTRKRSTSQQQNFFIPLDDNEDDDDNNNNNKDQVEHNKKENPLNKRQLLEKVEKLLAGDWTSSEADQIKKSATTTSDSSSNEKKHQINGKNHSVIAQWTNDDEEDKTAQNILNLTTNDDKSKHQHDDKSTCSLDHHQQQQHQRNNHDDLNLFKKQNSEKTPLKNVDEKNKKDPKEMPIEYEKKKNQDRVNIKINVYDDDDNDGDDNKPASSQNQMHHTTATNMNSVSDKRDKKFYERLNNFVRTGKFVDENDQNCVEEDVPRYNTYTSSNRISSLNNARPDHQQNHHKSKSALIKKDDTEIIPTSSGFWSRKYDDDPELADLAQRCENLLHRLQTQRHRAAILDSTDRPPLPSSYLYRSSTNNNRRHRSSTNLKKSTQQHNIRNRSISPTRYSRNRSLSPVKHNHNNEDLMSLQEALELLRPDFISRSRQRVRKIKLLREERKHNAEFNYERQLLFQPSRPQSHRSCCSCDKKKRPISAYDQRKRTKNHHINRPHSSRTEGRSNNICYTIPSTTLNRPFQNYQAMKQATKKKYDKLPEVNHRRQQQQLDEVRQRNVVRAKVFRTRLRQYVARYGKTNIDELLTMVDT